MLVLQYALKKQICDIVNCGLNYRNFFNLCDWLLYTGKHESVIVEEKGIVNGNCKAWS